MAAKVLLTQQWAQQAATTHTHSAQLSRHVFCAMCWGWRTALQRPAFAVHTPKAQAGQMNKPQNETTVRQHPCCCKARTTAPKHDKAKYRLRGRLMLGLVVSTSKLRKAASKPNSPHNLNVQRAHPPHACFSDDIDVAGIVVVYTTCCFKRRGRAACIILARSLHAATTTQHAARDMNTHALPNDVRLRLIQMSEVCPCSTLHAWHGQLHARDCDKTSTRLLDNLHHKLPA